MDSEYQHLRQEMLMWNERRFAVLTGAATLLTAFVAYVLSHRNEWSWPAALSIESAVVICACLFNWYGGKASARGSAFIQAAYPAEHWHRALAVLAKAEPRETRINLNRIIAMVYAVLMLAAAGVLLSTDGMRPAAIGEFVMAAVLTICCTMLLVGTARRSPSGPLREVFASILAEMDQRQGISGDPTLHGPVKPSREGSGSPSITGFTDDGQ